MPSIWTGRLRRHAPTDHTEEPPARPPLDFIPVELVGRVVASAEPATPESVRLDVVAQDIRPTAEPEEGWIRRTSLFGEPEA